MKDPNTFTLPSQRLPVDPDCAPGLAELQRKNAACQHVVTVGEPGPAALAVKFRNSEICPHCTRREASYWNARARAAEGQPPEGKP